MAVRMTAALTEVTARAETVLPMRPRPSRSRRSRPLFRWHWLAYAVVAVSLLIAAFGPALLTQDPLGQDLIARNLAPSAAHWLGTDSFGRDVFARMIAGTRLTIVVAFLASTLALIGGAGLGVIGCVLGGPLRTLIYAGFDIVRTMPPIQLSLALMVALGVGTSSVILAVGIAYMPLFAYVARAVYEREMASGYVAAARVIGAGPWAIASRHVLPNIAGALLTQIAIVLPRAVTTESVLSFFGLGVSPEVPTWGRVIATAVEFAEQTPTSLLFPVLALALLTLSLAVVGNHLRKRFDPLRPISAED
jgi:ABC-type dipeptide/oligopeptide/nickel transport system permease subunit